MFYATVGCPCWRCSPDRAGRALWAPNASLSNLVTASKFDVDLTYASPIIAPDGTIFVASLLGDLRAFQKLPSPTASGGDFWLSDPTAYAMVWRNATFASTPILATPAIAAGLAGAYTLIAAAGSAVVGIGGAAGSAAFAERWRADLCRSARVLAAWAAQFGAAAPCALRVDGSPAVARDGATAFVCGYGGAGPELGACVALRAADGAEVWASFINRGGFRSVRRPLRPPAPPSEAAPRAPPRAA
jgi:hypothetical protein